MVDRIPKSLWLGVSLIVLGCIALIALQLYQATASGTALRRDRDLVVHTFGVITTAQALERALQDVERGQRGYLLTGNSTYLTPYKDGVVTIPGQFGKLRQLTIDSPEQQRRMSLLKHEIDVKLGELARTIE